MSLKEIGQIIKYLAALSPKHRASVVDHVFILISSTLMARTAFDETSITYMYDQVGAFAPFTTFGLGMCALVGSLMGCNAIVNNLSNYD